MPDVDKVILGELVNALTAVSEIEQIMIRELETGFTPNPSDLRFEHNRLKASLAIIGELLAQKGK